MRIRTILLNGGAQTAKTTVTKNIESHIAGTGEAVMTHDIGLHFRRVTKAAREACRATGLILPDPDVLERHVRATVASNIATEPDVRWGELDTPGINAWVSTVANIPGVKADAVKGVERVASTALERGVGALVIAGRAPREQLASTGWFDRTGERTTMELFTTCEPVTAARRALTKAGCEQTPELVGEMAGSIITRRLKDELHTEFPCIEPLMAAVFESGATDPIEVGPAARAAVTSAYDHSDGNEPLPIMFNTTNLSMHEMYVATAALTDTAFQYAEMYATR